MRDNIEKLDKLTLELRGYSARTMPDELRGDATVLFRDCVRSLLKTFSKGDLARRMDVDPDTLRNSLRDGKQFAPLPVMESLVAAYRDNKLRRISPSKPRGMQAKHDFSDTPKPPMPAVFNELPTHIKSAAVCIVRTHPLTPEADGWQWCIPLKPLEAKHSKIEGSEEVYCIPPRNSESHIFYYVVTSSNILALHRLLSSGYEIATPPKSITIKAV
jgi:hypothetical protein